MRPSKRLLTLASAASLSAAANATAAPAAPSNPRVLTPFEAPGAPLQGITFEFLWDDNSDDEEGFEIEVYTDPDASPVFSTVTVADQTLTFVKVNINPVPFGVTVSFRVRAKNATAGDSPWSPMASGTLPLTDIAVQSHTYLHGVVGSPVTPFQPLTFNTNIASASGLPDGFALDPTTADIGGTPSASGVTRAVYEASDGVSVASTAVTVRVREPDPVVTVDSDPPSVALTTTSPPTTIDLDSLVSHRPVIAYRLTTNHGPLDLLLYPAATPLTVANFMAYADSGAYTDTVFHRSVDTGGAGIDIVQTGWFTPAGDASFTAIPTRPPIPNEPAFPNDRGTVAMAKTSNPDSATSQFYFNVQDNPELDTPLNAGGFTVFGRVSVPSLAVLDTLHALPTGAHDTTLDGEQGTIPDWPTNTPLADDASPAPGDLAQVLSAEKLGRIVSFAITGHTGDAAAAALDTGGHTLTLTPLSPGSSTTEITVTDLDGNTATTSITAAVTATPPLDPRTAAPSPVLATVGGQTYPAVTFTHTTTAAAPHYRVESSPDLRVWSTVWSTPDSFDHPLVVDRTTGTGETTLTVRSPAPVTSHSGKLYFRITLTR